MARTFADYWYRLCGKNPSLSNPSAKMTLTSESFRKQIARAYEAGKAAGERDPLGVGPDESDIQELLNMLRGSK